METGRRRPALAFFALAALSREDAALLVAWLGVVLLVGRREAWLGRRLALGAGAWAALCFLAILPYFSRGASLFAVRYGWLWSDPVSAPLSEIAAYLGLQLLSGGLLGVLAPLALLGAAPIVAMNALSGFDWMRSGGAHYSALLVPVLLWAAARGARRVRWPKTAPVVVLTSALAAYLWAGALPLAPEPDPHAAAVRAALAEIPSDAPVSASSGLVPHLSARSHAAWFPAGLADAEWIALDALGATHPLTVAETRARADELVGAGGFGVVAARDGLVLLRRGATDAAPLDEAASLPDHGQPAIATFGQAVELVEYRLRRWPEAGLFGDSATLETTWRVTAPTGDDLSFALATTRRSDGALVGLAADAPWVPTSRWRPGGLVRLAMHVSRLRRHEALGVAVLDARSERLPVRSELTLWEGGTILRLAGV